MKHNMNIINNNSATCNNDQCFGLQRQSMLEDGVNNKNLNSYLSERKYIYLTYIFFLLNIFGCLKIGEEGTRAKYNNSRNFTRL